MYAFDLKHRKRSEWKESIEEMSLGCEVLNPKKRLKLVYKMGECGVGVNKGNLVLVKVKDVEQMWQEASMFEQSAPV